MEIGEMLKEITPGLQKKIQEEAEKSIAQSLSWQLKAQIEEITAGYFRDHILPDVTKRLQSQHVHMVEAIVSAVDLSVDALKEAMVKKAIDRLKDEKVAEVIGRALFDNRSRY